VTGGRLLGRKLAVPPGLSVRPTGDRIREASFARLGDLADARVLDLFAGTGALGIEALSRGAAEAVFVERSSAVRQVLERNLRSCGLVPPQAQVVRSDARTALPRLARRGVRFDLVLVDPPYGPDAIPEALALLAGSGVLASGAMVVAERSRRHPLRPVAGLAILDERRYGETVVSRLAAGPGGSDEAAAPGRGAGAGGEPGCQGAAVGSGGPGRTGGGPRDAGPRDGDER